MICSVVNVIASIGQSSPLAFRQCGFYMTSQARLVAEQQKLQKRLKHALKIHHLRPKREKREDISRYNDSCRQGGKRP